MIGVLMPLIITPYVARVIGADGAGIYSYIASIVSYFVIFSNMGIESYAIREVAMHRDDPDFVKKFAWEITLLKVMLTAFFLGAYYFFTFFAVSGEQRTLYLLCSITLIATAFNFTWFFQGMERFNILAVASVISKITFAALIFLFVREKSDLVLYVAIVVATPLIEYLFSIPFMLTGIKGEVHGRLRPFSHLRGCFIYFLPTIAVEIYTVVDKTMIGLITHSEFENGYYEYAEKLVKVPLTVIFAFNAIMQARMAYYYAHEEGEAAHDLVRKSVNFTFMVALPMGFGIAAVAHSAIPLYLGDGFEKCVLLMYVLAPLIPIIAMSDCLGSLYYTPCGKRKTSALFLMIGAVVNMVLNSFMIYFWQSAGAAIASVTAEFVITTLYIIYAKKCITFRELASIAYKYLIASAVMGAAVFFLNGHLPPTIPWLVAEVAVGVAVYVVMLLLLRTRYFTENALGVLSSIRGKFGKKGTDDDRESEQEDE